MNTDTTQNSPNAFKIVPLKINIKLWPEPADIEYKYPADLENLQIDPLIIPMLLVGVLSVYLTTKKKRIVYSTQ